MPNDQGRHIRVRRAVVIKPLPKDIGRVATSKPVPDKDLIPDIDNLLPSRADILRDWWHDILRHHGKYSCCAFILALPTDKQAISYLTEFGKEIDLLSGKNCLVIAASNSLMMNSGFDESIWKSVVDDQLSSGQSIAIAEFFKIDFTEFPCMVIFRDIRSPEHLIVSLKKMEADDISQKMRSIFSVIQFAVSEKLDPLQELQRHKRKKEFQRAKQSIIGKIRNLAGKTFEIAIETLIKNATGHSFIQQPGE